MILLLFVFVAVMLEIFKTRHHLEGFELGVTALPRQVGSACKLTHLEPISIYLITVRKFRYAFTRHIASA